MLPPRLPHSVLAQTRRFLVDPFGLIEEAVRDHGDVFRARILGLGEWVFVASPEAVREMFKAPPDVLAAGEVNAAQLGFMLGLDATFCLDGDAHLVRRRLVHPFLNGRLVHRHVPLMRRVTERALAGWPRDEPFAFLPRAHRISLDVLMTVLFAASGEARVDELARLFDELATRGLRSPLMAIPALQLDLGPWSPWGRILRLRKRVREELAREVTRRVEAAADAADDGTPADGEGDVAAALAATPQKDGERLGAAALLDEVVNLLFAGHETTGTILAWCLAAVLSRPEVLARLRAEIDEVVGEGPVEGEHLERLPYLDAVINETIRFHPIAPMAGIRLVKRPFAVGGYTLEPGLVVAQCFPAMAARADLFPHPERFDPDHFLGRRLRPFEWNPFGGGTRMCVGRGLAEVELAVVLATLLRGADLRLAQDDVTPRRAGFFFAPSRGLRILVAG